MNMMVKLQVQMPLEEVQIYSLLKYLVNQTHILCLFFCSFIYLIKIRFLYRLLEIKLVEVIYV